MKENKTNEGIIAVLTTAITTAIMICMLETASLGQETRVATMRGDLTRATRVKDITVSKSRRLFVLW